MTTRPPGPVPPRVTVAVVTYRRAEPLARLLRQLREQRTDDGRLPAVLVVDNDPARSAEQVVQDADGLATYVHEPRPGISAARNAALAAVPDGLLVFVDDDEEPCEDWLVQLTGCYARESGDRPLAGVVGPVVSRFDGEPDAWVRAGRFFDRRRLPTGTAVEVAATNNLLLDRAVVADLRFDEAFGLSGGSDTLFTRQLTSGGHRLLWCAEALVTDVVPPERLRKEWVLRRARRSGNGWARCELLLGDGPRWRRRSRLVLAGAVRVAGGAARWGLGTLARSLPQQARGARTFARGAGMVSGALGHVVVEYRRAPEAGVASAGPLP